MTLERDLRRALARKDPPPGFEARLASRMAARPRVAAAAPPSRGARAWLLTLAASVAIVLGLGLYVRDEEARRAREAEIRADRATRQLVLALQIASEQIVAVQAKVEEIGR